MTRTTAGRSWIVAVVIIGGACYAPTACCQTADKTSSWKETRLKPLGALPSEHSWSMLSSRGDRLAYAHKEHVGWSVVCDGKSGPIYDRVRSFFFSPDGQHTAYVAERGRKSYLIWDGNEGKGYQMMYIPVFSPDSRQVAVVAEVSLVRGKEGWSEQFVLRGTEEGPRFSWGTFCCFFSPNSIHLAYAANRASRWFCVCDGKEGPAYDSVEWVVFSADSRRLAYTAKSANHYFVVCDEQEGGRYDRTEMLTFSPDSRRLAYWASRAGKWFVVCNGKEEGQFDEIIVNVEKRSFPSWPIFSPDGVHFAYAGSRGGKGFLVLDGKEEPIDGNIILRPVFSPDGAYLAYTCESDGKQFVVCGGKRGKTYDRVGPPIFSADSGHLAYEAWRGKDGMIVCDGLEGPPHEWVRIPRQWIPENAAWGRSPTATDKLRYAVADKEEAWLVEVAWPVPPESPIQP